MKFGIHVVCLLTSLLIAGSLCASNPFGRPRLVTSPGDSDPSMDWYRRSSTEKLRGVALVIHGLNLNPARMAAVITTLNNVGIDALRLSLRGHGDNFRQREGLDVNQSRLEDFKGVSYPVWLQETLKGHEEARSRARETGVPLFLIGFSYGGLIGLDLLTARPDTAFERSVLFAPALSLNGWDYTIRLLSPFPRLVIPALAPAEYLANPGTPMAAYNVLFETLGHFESHASPKINIPTLVVMDPGDELVSLRGIKRLAEAHHLGQWQFHPVRSGRSLLKGMLRHIVIDEAAVGGQAWAEITKGMIAHLLQNRP
jgi:pimeloyl-ACP methyl ester carboxylesterase